MRGGKRPGTEEEQVSAGASQRRKCMAVWVSAYPLRLQGVGHGYDAVFKVQI